jgi:hypothetical protein
LNNTTRSDTRTPTTARPAIFSTGSGSPVDWSTASRSETDRWRPAALAKAPRAIRPLPDPEARLRSDNSCRGLRTPCPSTRSAKATRPPSSLPQSASSQSAAASISETPN